MSAPSLCLPWKASRLTPGCERNRCDWVVNTPYRLPAGKRNNSDGSLCLWGMPMLTVTSSVAGVADVVLIHVDLERAGSLHER